jgi:branched-chain amino acid transport system permease protein
MSQDVSQAGGISDIALARFSRRRMLAAVGGLILVAAFTVYYIETGTSYSLFILNSILLAIIGSSALNLLQGTAGQISIGNGAFLCVGAFASVVALRSGIGYPYDLLFAIVVGALLGALVGLPAIRIRGFYLAFATLAAQFIFTQLAETYQTHEVGSSGFIVPLQFTSETLEGQQRSWAYVLVGFAIVTLIIVRWLTTFRLGRAWRLIRDHETIAPSLGIPVTQYKLAAFMISSALISLEGGLTAHLSGYVSSDSFTLALAISYLAMVMIGGQDSIMGSVIGAIVVTSLPYVTENVMSGVASNSQYAPQFSEILYGGLIVVFIVFSTAGIAGWFRKGFDLVLGERSAGRGGGSRSGPDAATGLGVPEVP